MWAPPDEEGLGKFRSRTSSRTDTHTPSQTPSSRPRDRDHGGDDPTRASSSSDATRPHRGVEAGVQILHGAIGGGGRCDAPSSTGATILHGVTSGRGPHASPHVSGIRLIPRLGRGRRHRGDARVPGGDPTAPRHRDQFVVHRQGSVRQGTRVQRQRRPREVQARLPGPRRRPGRTRGSNQGRQRQRYLHHRGQRARHEQRRSNLQPRNHRQVRVQSLRR